MIAFERKVQIFTILNRIHEIGSLCVNKHPYHFKLEKEKYFTNYLSSKWWRNRIKVFSWRFPKCLRPFNMLTSELCSETVLFSEWSNQVFDSLQFRKYISSDDHLFLKMFKIWCRFDNWHKKLEKVFRF